MAWTINTSVQADMYNRLTEVFKGKPNFEALLGCFSPQFDELESLSDTMINDINIDNATGAQLDGWGGILDVDRAGQDDDTFRIRLKAAIFRYVSDGRFEEILQGFTVLLNPTLARGQELFPATVRLEAIDPDPITVGASEIANALSELKSAGVDIDAVVTSDTEAFSFFEDPDISGLGFDDGTGTVGGTLADRII